MLSRRDVLTAAVAAGAASPPRHKHRSPPNA